MITIKKIHTFDDSMSYSHDFFICLSYNKQKKIAFDRLTKVIIYDNILGELMS